ncbi:unnamed protein product [Rotaria sp. Silwood2]|nr:unnamed protein product [Rotaria sp. Silwood2]CAF2998295.1 unnamed protein product [Rotaria sp. Silwood2]CAF3431742.1 unnamed protein product [Rotaria sp. Silwood2]CAF3863446.1 unnamed protein product [Rotaria sp. Silwood2]CAF4413505.1 unnamed protein product [Rotaria sp. Silwood2]
MNTSIARTINQTPFEVVFGQQPRMDDHVWKCIKSHLKDRQHDEPNHNILEEDLPADIFDMIKQVDDIEGPPIDTIEGPPVDAIEGPPADRQTINSNEEPICTNVTAAVNTNDQQTQREEEKDSGFTIDHEELIDATTFIVNVVESKPESIAVNRHRRIRENAEECYLNNAHSQLTKYNTKSSKRQRVYQLGDIVGLKVSDVDRTNTSSTILPCKIVDLKDYDGEILYNVATINGIIEQSFQSTAFLDLTTSNFMALRNLNTDSLSSITFIHACQLYTNFKSAGTCKCNGDCSTNRCQCKKKNQKCCSKCHAGTDSKCTNC